MFERLLQGEPGLAVRSQLFLSENLLALQPRYPLLIRGNDGPIAGINDSVEQRFDLLLDLSDVRLQDLCRFAGLCEPHIPGILEHGLDDVEQVRRRLKALEYAFKRRFQFLALDRLAIALATLRRAVVIGVLLRLALRPAGRQRLAAVVTQDEAAQREIGVDVLARWSLGCALEPCLYLLESLEADKSFVLPLAQPDAPIRRFDVPRINDAGEQIMDTLVAYLAIRQVLRKGRLPFEEALDLDLRFKAPGSIAFQRFLQDGGIGVVAHQQLAVTAWAFVAIADRSLENPISVLRPRPHPVDRLLAVFLALMLRDGGEQVLDQLGI
ncbi:hypothetical protein VB618_05690 [Microvirga sp. CF3062]|nr:hypothetical protein [Microvirga sp. CF3062]MEE1655681.1 hypothetical protein [Microvirga sp. CF3062]